MTSADDASSSMLIPCGNGSIPNPDPAAHLFEVIETSEVKTKTI